MTSAKIKVIGLHYTLKNDAGEVLESSEGGHPMLYLAGSGQVLLTLDKEIQGLAAGETKSVSLAAKDAYGQINPALQTNIKIDQFPAGTDVKLGLKFRASNEPGTPTYRVTKISGADVSIDANHPLAGENLHFDVEITEKRDATDDEIAHGHAHGEGGHHH